MASTQSRDALLASSLRTAIPRARGTVFCYSHSTQSRLFVSYVSRQGHSILQPSVSTIVVFNLTVHRRKAFETFEVPDQE